MIVSYINENIQAELERRRKALARESVSPLESGTGGTRQFNEYLSRTPYVVMASNLKPPEFNVAIGGGSHFNPTQYTNPEKFLNDDKTRKSEGLPLLVNHMHGFKNDGTGAYRATVSKGISPIPGIKDISVEYKGGYKGIREATVNWAVSNLEDLEFYTPHFLAIGRSVALEWGWTMFDTPNTHKFITYAGSAITVDGELFTKPSDVIIEGNGNLDGIGGVVTNFNFKLRDDGGFDCTTTLSALGVNFFGGDGLDSSAEVGLGLILSEKDEVEIELAADMDEGAKKNLRDAALLKIDATRRSNIIEELINLPAKLIWAMKDTTETDFGMNPPGTDGHKTVAYIWKSPTPGDKPLNYFRWKHHFDSGHDMKKDFMIRWGWLEDNVFSKYTSAKGKGSEEVLFNFRSIGDDGNSIKILYNKNLIPINPFRSMIFADSTAFDDIILDGGNLDIASNVTNNKGNTGKNDAYFTPVKNYFKAYCTGTGPIKFNAGGTDDNLSGYGKMRNIFVSLTDILESFGVTSEYVEKLVNIKREHVINDRGRGATHYSRAWAVIKADVGAKTLTNANAGYSYFAPTDKITPPKTMESAINTLLKKINRNFHNFWKFQIVSDTETMDNVRIVDENYVAPNPTKGPEQPIDYTSFGLNGEPAGDIGIYKFPSFTIGSTVKSQTLEFKLPDQMKTVAMYGTNSPKIGAPADPLMKAFKDLGAINKNPFIKNDADGTHILSELSHVYMDEGGGLTYGSTYARTSDQTKIHLNLTETVHDIADKLTLGGNTAMTYEGGKNILKFIKVQEKTNEDSSGQSLGTGEDHELHTRKEFYVIDSTSDTIVLKSAAVSKVRSDLGISTGANKSYLIPAELGLEIDGIGGIKPGNICHTDYMQRIYNERNGSEGELGPNTFFQIFGITQKVSDDGWVTSLETKMRLNGNALGGQMAGSFDGVLDMDFGTPVSDRQSAANTARVQSAASVPPDLTDEAAEEDVSATEMTDEEVTNEVVDEQEVENAPAEPVTTAVKAAVTDTRTGPNGEEVKLSSAGKYFYIDSAGNANILPGETRDELQSQAAIVAAAAKVETQTTVAKKSKEVKATEVVPSEASLQAAEYDARMNEEVNKITYKIISDTQYMSDLKFHHTVEGTYTGDLSIDGENPFEYTIKHTQRSTAGVKARNKVLSHFSKLVRPLVKEEVGL
jgi:hypothetical protein